MEVRIDKFNLYPSSTFSLRMGTVYFLPLDDISQRLENLRRKVEREDAVREEEEMEMR
jgi:hypothetical protein